MNNVKLPAIWLVMCCVISLPAMAADYTWGGAGSSSAAVYWDDTGNNSLPDHWNSAADYSPNVGGVDNVVIPSGGLQKSATVVDGPSSMTISGGYFYTGGFDIGKNSTGASFTLQSGEVNCQWFSVYPSSTGEFVSGSINVRGSGEPLPARGEGGFINFTGTSGTLTASGKSASYFEDKIIAGILRIDGVHLTSASQVVNDRHFVIDGTTLTIIEKNDWIATEPTPGNGVEDQETDVSLGWLLGDGATACDVYFGTDPDVTSNPKVVDGQLVTSYTPAENLGYETTYYWRVDTHADGSIHEGPTWSFTTVPALVNTLVAYWDFEEGSGTQTTAAVGSPAADGTLNGCTWITSDLATVPGGTSAALVFDPAADDHITTDYRGVIGTKARTVALWIRSNPLPAENSTMISWGSSSNNNRYSFRLNATSQGTPYALRLEIQSTYVVGKMAMDDGQWHHVAVTHDAGAGIQDVQFYIDGIAEEGFSGQGSNSTIDTGTDSPVVIGSSFQNIATYGFDGGLDDVRIYDYALSAKEVEDLFIGTIPRPVNPDPAPADDHVDTTATLEWEVINATDPTYDVNIGTDADCDDVLVGAATGSTASFEIPAGMLDYSTTYYWRVDVTDAGDEYPGYVWFFTTGGVATDPDPADGATAKDGQRYLSWTGDEMIASYNVFAGTSKTLKLVGNYAESTVSFKDIASKLSLIRLPEGSSYKWRVDSLDGEGAVMTTGDVWAFTLPTTSGDVYGVLEDFDGFLDDAELTASWTVTLGASIALDELTNIMEYSYDCSAFPNECAIQHVFDPVGDWVYDDYKSLQINFRGDENNGSEVMYVILSDGTNSVKVVHDDPDALTDYQWQTWDIPLAAFAGVNIESVQSIRIGFGDGIAPGGKGLVYYNDMLLYPDRCIKGLTADGDFNGDCAVDMLDLLIIAPDWLKADFQVAAQQPSASGLRISYQFEEADGVAVVDSSGLGNNGTIEPDATGVRLAGGQTGQCLQLDNDVSVVIPSAVFDDIDQAVTVSLWLKGLAADFGSDVTTAAFEAGDVPIEENIRDRLLWEIDDVTSYAGQWNHYAFVKDALAAQMRIYHNGKLVARNIDASEPVNGALSGDSVLSASFLDDSTVKIDDLRIYDYPLTQAEVVYLAGGADADITQPISPVLTNAEVNGDGTVNLADFAPMAEDWMSEVMWPGL